MHKITIGLFNNQEMAENAINELSHNGFSLSEISIVMKNQEAAMQMIRNMNSDAISMNLLEKLTKLGLSVEEAKHYEEDIINGFILLGVPIPDVSEKTIKQIFERHQAKQIRSLAVEPEKV